MMLFLLHIKKNRKMYFYKRWFYAISPLCVMKIKLAFKIYRPILSVSGFSEIPQYAWYVVLLLHYPAEVSKPQLLTTERRAAIKLEETVVRLPLNFAVFQKCLDMSWV